MCKNTQSKIQKDYRKGRVEEREREREGGRCSRRENNTAPISSDHNKISATIYSLQSREVNRTHFILILKSVVIFREKVKSFFVTMHMDKCCFCFDQENGVQMLGIILVGLSASGVIAGAVLIHQVCCLL